MNVNGFDLNAMCDRVCGQVLHRDVDGCDDLLDYEYARRWYDDGGGDHVLRGRHAICA